MSTNAPTTRQTHPAIIVAAVAVAGFAIVGTAALLGWLPGAKSTTTPVSVASPAQQVSAGTSAEYPVPEAPAPAAEKPAVKPAAKPAAAPAPAAKPAPQASAPVAGTKPQPSKPTYEESAPKPAVASAPPTPKICSNCGTVTDITKVEQPGEGSGLGAVVGGVVGGVLGHQVGGGRGKDVATVVGAAGGAYAGHQIEKSKTATASWEVRVKLEDGSTRVVKYASQPKLRIGDKVRLEGEKLVREG